MYERAPRLAWICGMEAFLAFLVLSTAYSFTRSPWWDEGLFADVAVHFRKFGTLGSSVLASHSYLDLPEVDRYTYWHFPLYPLSLGTWFHFAPITVQSMRMYSVLWGCI